MKEVKLWQGKYEEANEDHSKDEASLSSELGDTFG
jgi:hypothetical protein